MTRTAQGFLRKPGGKGIHPVLFCVTLTLLAGAIRVASARGDLWLDEIWTLYLLRRVQGMTEIFSIHHDNNHILTSLYLHFLEHSDSVLLCRLLSIITGTASIALMGIINFRHGVKEGFIALVIGAFSYPLIHYGSEARGYSPAILFSLLSYYLLQRSNEVDSLRTVILFWVSCIMGLLAHLTFYYVLTSLLLSSLGRAIILRANPREAIPTFLKYHGIPLMGAILIYSLHIRQMTYGGGDSQALSAVFGELSALLSGATASQAAQFVGVIFALAGLLGGLVCLYVRSPDELPFYVSVLFVSPVTLWALSPSTFIYSRYFLLCFPFYYLMLARLLALLWEKGATARLAVAAFMVLFLWGNIHKSLDLLGAGRGSYREALLYMAERSPGQDILVGSDHDFRNKLVLIYYSRYLPENKRVIYFDRGEWPKGGPDWLVLHSQQSDFTPEQEINPGNGVPYRLARHFPYSSLSGWHWAIYQRQ